MSNPGIKSEKSVVAKAAKIEKLLAKLFRAHWQEVSARLADGVDVAEEQAFSFLAGDPRRYYTASRAAEFAAASTASVVDLCWAWFIPFQIYVYKCNPDWSEIEETLERLVTAGHVAVTWRLLEPRPPYPEWGLSEPDFFDDEDCYACPEVRHIVTDGLIFEYIIAEDFGHYLRVSKSVAEPFLRAERVQVMDAIERELLVESIDQGDDPRALSINFLPPEGLGMYIEADVLCNIKDASQREVHKDLARCLKANGKGYLKRSRPRIPKWFR